MDAIARPPGWREGFGAQQWQVRQHRLTVRERCVPWGAGAGRVAAPALLRPESHRGFLNVHTPRAGPLGSMMGTGSSFASLATAPGRCSAASHSTASSRELDEAHAEIEQLKTARDMIMLEAQLAAQPQPKPPGSARTPRSKLIKNGTRRKLGPLDRSKALAGCAAEEAKERRRKGQETLAREQKLKHEQDAIRAKKHRRPRIPTAARTDKSLGPAFWTPDPEQQRGNGY